MHNQLSITTDPLAHVDATSSSRLAERGWRDASWRPPAPPHAGGGCAESAKEISPGQGAQRATPPWVSIPHHHSPVRARDGAPTRNTGREMRLVPLCPNGCMQLCAPSLALSVLRFLRCRVPGAAGLRFASALCPGLYYLAAPSALRISRASDALLDAARTPRLPLLHSRTRGPSVTG